MSFPLLFRSVFVLIVSSTRLGLEHAMDKLEEAFNALAAHIDIHGKSGPRNGFIEVAQDLGMSIEDLSGGSDINYEISMDGEKIGKLAMSYLMVPVGENDPIREHYSLELTDLGSKSQARVWHFLGGKRVEKEPLPKAA